MGKNGISSFCCLFFLLPCFLSALPEELTKPDGKSFAEHGEAVDSFLERTAKRISDAWSMCSFEFREASSSAVTETKNFVKEEVKKQGDALIESAKEEVKEHLHQKIDETADGKLPEEPEKKDAEDSGSAVK